MRALFVTVDAGGNLPPALGIAAEIVRRGGRARFLGHQPQRAVVERAGFAFDAMTQGRPYDSAEPRGTVSAGVDAVGAAAGELLADGTHRAAARLGAEIRERDGAATAVDLLAGVTAATEV